MPQSDLWICIATVGRANPLTRLLSSLASDGDQIWGQVSVVVVDNGRDGGLMAAEAELQDLAGLHTVVVHEPRAGIPFARNRSIDVALAAGARWLVFVDDDEEVTHGWLQQLMKAAEDHQSHVVTGPVLTEYPSNAPAWMRDAGLHQRPRRPTGTILKTVATNNTLVSSEVFRSVTPWFDETLALTGGSDAEYFTRVGMAGFKMTWVDEAPVVEHLEPARSTVRWYLLRALRTGISVGGALRRNEGLWARSTMRRAALGTGRFVVSSVVALGKLPMGRGVATKELRRAVVGLGQVAGVLGIRYEEYRKAHDSSRRVRYPTW